MESFGQDTDRAIYQHGIASKEGKVECDYFSNHPDVIGLWPLDGVLAANHRDT